MDNIHFVNIQDEEPGGDRFEIYPSDDHQYYFRQQQPTEVMSAEEGLELVNPLHPSQSQTPSPPVQPSKRSSPPTFGGFEHWLRNWLQYDLMTMSARKLALVAVSTLAVVALLGLAVYGISRAASSVGSDNNDGPKVPGTSFAVRTLQQPSSNASTAAKIKQQNSGQSTSSTITFTTTTPKSTTPKSTTPKSTTPKPTPKPSKLLNQITSSRERAAHVRSMAASAWAAYQRHAWSHASLKPVSNLPDHRLFGPRSGRTLINAMSSLVVMNLTEEFETSANWVRDHFNLTKINRRMNVCDLVTDFIGGLLSVYALTERELFKEKALEVAKLLGPAYETHSGLPYEHVNPNQTTAYDDTTWLTWAGGQLLEYSYLEYLFPEESDLVKRTNRMRSTLLKWVVDPDTGLYPERLGVDTPGFKSSFRNRNSFVVSDTADFGWGSRQFYSVLGKSYLLTEYADSDALRAFHNAIEAAYKAGMFANYTSSSASSSYSFSKLSPSRKTTLDSMADWRQQYVRTTTTPAPPSDQETFLYVHQIKISQPKVDKEKARDIFDEEHDLDDIDEADEDFEDIRTLFRAVPIIPKSPNRKENKEKKKTNDWPWSKTTESSSSSSSFLNENVNKEEFEGSLLMMDESKTPSPLPPPPLTDWRKMTYHSCYLGGLLELLAEHDLDDVNINEKYSGLAKGLTRTCIQAAQRSKTGLAPWTFYFDRQRGATGAAATNPDGVGFYEQANLMNPELAESLFIMWRKTGDPTYQEAAWEMVRAMETHCRTASGGYSALADVNRLPAAQEDSQSPYLFGTLKYLYLIFSDDDEADDETDPDQDRQLLPLESWVFNTVGHPLPTFSPRSAAHNQRYLDTEIKKLHTHFSRFIQGAEVQRRMRMRKRKKTTTSTTTPDSLRLDRP